MTPVRDLRMFHAAVGKKSLPTPDIYDNVIPHAVTVLCYTAIMCECMQCYFFYCRCTVDYLLST